MEPSRKSEDTMFVLAFFELIGWATLTARRVAPSRSVKGRPLIGARASRAAIGARARIPIFALFLQQRLMIILNIEDP